MSGGHFDYKQHAVRDIADKIERDIAWSKDFETYEKAEEYLLSCGNIIKAEQKYIDLKLFADKSQYQSTNQYMERVPDGEQIPVLYEIHHIVSDHYPYEEDVLELKESTIGTMKEAYRILRLAEIYAKRIDWMMSGDDSEESMKERLKEELDVFEQEYVSKDWTVLEEDE